jgi:long-chain fatty acid transport protein
MKKNTRTALTLIAFSTPFISMTAQGAGLQLMPGSPNFGTAGAGHAAAGFGAGSAWANPATMVLVEDQQIGFGIIAAETDVNFNPDDPDGNGGGDAGGNLYIPSFAYVNSINENVSVGFSVVVPYGNSLSYDEDWDGNNVATDVSLETIQAMPSIAYRINEQFSVGFGISANHTTVAQDLKIDLGRSSVDAELEADSVDYGYTVGGLYEINENHRLGFVYRSQVDSDLEGSGKLMGDTYDSELDWVNPASIVFSGVHQVSEKTSLLWDVGRTFYSAFETTNISIQDAPMGLDEIALHRNWEDANRYAIGTHYQLNDKVILQAGFAYEDSVVSDENRTVDMPLDRIMRYTAGALYQVNTDTQLAFGIEYADLGDAKVTSEGSPPPFTGPDGSYDNSALAASFSVNYQF